MRILVVSDTHGDNYALEQVALREPGIDLYLHAGDVCAPKESISPFAAVRGNCDGYFREDYKPTYEIKTPYGKLHMEHYPVSDIYEASLETEGVKIFIHGHTHVREARNDNGIYTFCPGSLAFPRDNGKGTYLILDITEKEVKATFKEL